MGKSGSGGGIGAIVGAAIGSIIPGVGTAIGAAAGAAIGGSAGGAIGANMDAAAAGRKMQAEMNNIANASKQNTPIIPTTNSSQINAAKQMRALELSRRSGKASTFLTDKFGG
jgi:phage tail tape-measure protein